jgi:pantoate--beta-alanine ligase
MFLIKSAVDLDITLSSFRKKGKKIGFVATMGALHEGHISLIQRSKQENDTTVCSIFVNPRQFNDPADLAKYPRPIERDIHLLGSANVDILFLPEVNDVYPQNYISPQVDLNGLENVLEGSARPGHFKGVGQVVKRLFECVKPDRAYFGQKDFQQTLVIKHLVKQFQLPIEIINCPILREPNGLAMSSRNIRLSDEDRQQSGFIYAALNKLKHNCTEMSLSEALNIARKDIESQNGAVIEYFEIVNPENLQSIDKIEKDEIAIALIVVNYHGVRLLDNLYLSVN